MTERIRECIRMVAIGVTIGAAVAMFGIGDALADPTIRVARLSYMTGSVSFSPAGDDQWAQAVLNRPLVTGDRIWSDTGARTELAFDTGALWLGSATSLVVSNIDDRTAQFELQQGVLDLRVRQMPQGAIVEVDTPNLAFQVTQPGRYRLVVDPQGGTTSVTVRNGGAAVYGESASYAVAAGQAYRFAGTDLQDGGALAAEGGDEFDRFVDQRDTRFTRVVASTRYVSPEVVGYEDLDQYGAWQANAEYGNVWYPQDVPSGWAPYRYGHWSWIDPWGWTWVDEAPWGFAPFHYGRWAYVQNRWGWVPGPVNVRPVYAPALVAFIGGAGFGVAVSSGPAIGWFPLGPREVYMPAYNVSREYYRQVNVSNTVINNTVINNTYVSNVTSTTAPLPRASYRNLQAPNAVTAVPPAAMAQAQRVDRVAVKLAPTAITQAQIQPMAKVAPARTAFTGDAQPTHTTPPATAQQRTVIAKVAPPPAPPTVTQQLTALQKDPGKPLDRAQMQAARPAGSANAPERGVKVVNAAKAPTAPPPIAQRARPPEAAGKAATPPVEAGRPTPEAAKGGPPPRGVSPKTMAREPNAPVTESAKGGPPPRGESPKTMAREPNAPVVTESAKGGPPSRGESPKTVAREPNAPVNESAKGGPPPRGESPKTMAREPNAPVTESAKGGPPPRGENPKTESAKAGPPPRGESPKTMAREPNAPVTESAKGAPPPQAQVQRAPPPERATPQTPPPQAQVQRAPPPERATPQTPPPQAQVQRAPPPERATPQTPPPQAQVQHAPVPATPQTPPPQAQVQRAPQAAAPQAQPAPKAEAKSEAKKEKSEKDKEKEKEKQG